MCEIKLKVSCPHCLSAKVVKNGHKKTTAQNFLCRSCGKQFQFFYRNRGAAPSTKKLITSLLLRNNGIRDIETVLGVSRGCALNVLLTELYQLLKPLQIDTYCTDNWKAFKRVFRHEDHQIGKHLTRQVEGINASLRARNRRFVRQTTCFSKKDKYHAAAIKIMFQQRNYAYHTF